ncbi:MAG: hypothetical protein QW796_03855 [Thermoproteota archaeon]
MNRVGSMFLIVLLAVMAMSVIVGNYIIPKQSANIVPDSTAYEDFYAHSHSPAPFPGEIVPLDTVVSQLAKEGFTLYLPTKMVKGMELTAVWAKIRDGRVGFPIIVLYSNTGDKDIETAEIGIEIAPMPEIPFHVTNSSRDRFDKIGEWTVFICKEAPMGYREYYQKYGTEYAYLVDIKIGPLNYLFSFAPVLTEKEIMEICESMRPVIPKK